MIDLTPSAVRGDTLDYPSQGAIFGVAIPWMASPPTYTDLPVYWSPRRDWVLSNTPKKEDMWGSAVAIATTKFAAHGFTITDSTDSQRKVSASQELMKRADGGQGQPWAAAELRLVAVGQLLAGSGRDERGDRGEDGR